MPRESEQYSSTGLTDADGAGAPAGMGRRAAPYDAAAGGSRPHRGWSLRSSISLRQGITGALAALLIGTLLTTADLVWVAARERDQAGREAQAIANQLEGSAALAAWNIDPQLADQVIKDHLKLEDVAGLEIYLNDGSLLAAGSAPLQVGSRLETLIAHAVFSDVLSTSRDLYRPDGPRADQIGRLRVTLDPVVVSRNLMAIIGATALSELLRNLLLALALVLVLHRYVTRPLLELGRVIARVDPEHPGDVMLPVPRGHEQDELGYIANRTNELLTRLAQSQETLRFMATRDALTGLPNRALLTEEIMRALTKAQRQGTRVALLFMDLDRFKAVNDSLGHDTGDRLLREVGTRVAQVLRASDIIARLGGDEFVVMTEDITRPEAAITLAQRILDVIRQSYDLDGTTASIDTSIGIALYPDDGDNPEALLRAADVAMYTAKSAGGASYSFFTTAMMDQAIIRLRTEATLKAALENHEFRLYYQPILDARSRRLSGAEALIRWQRADRLVMPGEFMPIAEETGLVIAMGAWVMRQAVAQAAAWLAQGHAIPISVNVSGRQLGDPGLLALVGDTLAESGLPPQLLILEITETVMMRDFEAALSVLEQLRALGVGIAVDDFGTGYSSLAYLRRLPATVLKLDRSFVSDLPGDTAIANAILELARNFALSTVAEGVERADQLDWLSARGCQRVQGFLFAPALPVSEFNHRFVPAAAPIPPG